MILFLLLDMEKNLENKKNCLSNFVKLIHLKLISKWADILIL